MSKNLHRAVRNASIRSVLSSESRKRKRAIRSFSDKNGLVCLGSVDQYSDEHKIVRGFTISASHRDDSYCVGSVGDYEMAIVDRSDAMWQKDGSISIHKWLIMSFRLKANLVLPHFFIGAKNHAEEHFEAMLTVYPALRPVEMGVFEEYGEDFISRFDVFVKPSDGIEVQKLIPADTARVFGAHFWPLSVECSGGFLYVLSSAKEINEKLLDAMIENGLWLAGHLDERIESI